MERPIYRDSPPGKRNMHSPPYDNGIPVSIGKRWRPRQPVFVTALTLLNDMEEYGASESKESSTTHSVYSERIYANGKLTSSIDWTKNQTTARSYGSTTSSVAKAKQPSANTSSTPTKTQYSSRRAQQKMPAMSSSAPNTTPKSS